MQLHQRGIDLLVNVHDAVDHFDTLTREEMRSLLQETSVVLGQLLERDIPADGVADGQPETHAWRKQ